MHMCTKFADHNPEKRTRQATTYYHPTPLKAMQCIWCARIYRVAEVSRSSCLALLLCLLACLMIYTRLTIQFLCSIQPALSCQPKQHSCWRILYMLFDHQLDGQLSAWQNAGLPGRCDSIGPTSRSLAGTTRSSAQKVKGGSLRTTVGICRNKHIV
jgi:hypothetical protein